MPDTADYDISSLKIDPQALSTEGHTLLSLAQQMGESIVHVNNIVSGLKLGWAGSTSDEAHAFSDRWIGVMTDVFGDEDGAGGMLPALVAGILGTAVGFSQVEQELETGWNNFSLSLGASGDGSGPTDHVGPDFPITQDFPN
ncbi:hypothetical protein OG900_12050 [Streptomyces sp. NBC_00433]